MRASAFCFGGLLLRQSGRPRLFRLLTGLFGLAFCFFGFLPLAFRLLALRFGQLTLLLGLLPLRFSLFSAALLRDLLLFALASNRQQASIFGGLNRSARDGGNRLVALITAIIVLGAVQKIFRFTQGIGSILRGSGSAGDRNCVNGLLKIQRHLLVGGLGGKLRRRNIDRIFAALEHVELGVDRLFKTLWIFPEDVLQDHLIAWDGYCIVRLGGYDHPERLQVGG